MGLVKWSLPSSNWTLLAGNPWTKCEVLWAIATRDDLNVGFGMLWGRPTLKQSHSNLLGVIGVSNIQTSPPYFADQEIPWMFQFLLQMGLRSCNLAVEAPLGPISPAWFLEAHDNQALQPGLSKNLSKNVMELYQLMFWIDVSILRFLKPSVPTWKAFVRRSKSECIVSNAITGYIWLQGRPQSMWFVNVYHFSMFL